MSILHLEHLFAPSAIAIVGASRRHRSVGNTVMRNVLEGGFEGPVLPVNPKYQSVAGVLAYPSVAALPIEVDLAVLCTPPETVPTLLDELGTQGTKAAIVLTAGLDRRTEDGRSLTEQALGIAGKHGMRLLGPNCVGLLVPRIGLNASFAHTGASDGNLAFLSQSGAMCTAVLDWARRNGVGFSHFVSLGESADVDLADVVDYLGEDRQVRALLLYIESVRHARKFLSAARSVSRSLPIVAIKAGRDPEGSRAAASHSGALVANDEAYDAAFSRAGILRVDSTDQLFDAVETLARSRPIAGDGLLVVSNGGGPAVMAVDRLMARGGRLARLSEETLTALDEVLPPNWPRSNPIDLIGDAPPERYRQAIEIAVRDPDVDAVLFLHAPTAVLSGQEAARAVMAATEAVRRPVLTCVLGGHDLEAARQLLREAGVPTYETLERAVDAFVGLVANRRLHIALRQTPPSLPETFVPRVDRARTVIAAAIAEGRPLLGELEAKQVLEAYGIPIVESHHARDAEEAVRAADRLGYPVAVKVCTPEISHKSDVGGVVLDLESAGAVREAIAGIRSRVARAAPAISDPAFSVQRMASSTHGREVIVGMMRDPVFGPLVVFGHGGTAVEVLDDSAVALPPLNSLLARALIEQTRVARLLHGYRDEPAADLDGLTGVLVKVSQLIVDFPELTELDINPLLVDQHGVLALDARIGVAGCQGSGTDHLSIRPYPQELEEAIEIEGQTLLLRPIRPEDEPAHRRLFEGLTPEATYFRFFGFVRELPHERLSRYTQIDYDREMAFVAVRGEGDEAETLGVVRLIFGARPDRVEFAIVVRSDCQGMGLGRRLMEKGIRYCRERGARQVVGQVLWENHRMRTLARELGFHSRRIEGDVVEVTLELTGDGPGHGAGPRDPVAS